MIDLKEAAKLANDYFGDIYADESFSDVRLEEVEFNDEQNQWLITLGFSPDDHDRRPLENVFSKYSNRHYKVFRIDAESGRVLSMKIRVLQNA